MSKPPLRATSKQNLDQMIRVRVSPNLKKRVERVAKRRGMDVSDVVRELVIKHADENEAALAASR